MQRRDVLTVASCLGIGFADRATARLSSAVTPASPLATRVDRWLDAWPPVDALLIGETHDAPDHPEAVSAFIRGLATRERLADVLFEMVDAPASTEGLRADADEAAVRAALGWNDAAWPWARYGPIVMAAVRAGRTVRGANLPRERVRAAMLEPSWEARLPPLGWQAQREAIRTGHCGLLPEGQIGPVARAQVARDTAMAEAIVAAVKAQPSPGRTTLLIAGAGHVRRDVGVPRWLVSHASLQSVVLAPPNSDVSTDWSVDAVILTTAARPVGDPCDQLRRPRLPQRSPVPDNK